MFYVRMYLNIVWMLYHNSVTLKAVRIQICLGEWMKSDLLFFGKNDVVSLLAKATKLKFYQ